MYVRECFAYVLLIWKDPDAGKDWGQEEKGMTVDEMVGWHHWLDGHRFGWTPGVVMVGRPGVLRFMGSQSVRHNWTTELNWSSIFIHRELTQPEYSFLEIYTDVQHGKSAGCIAIALCDPFSIGQLILPTHTLIYAYLHIKISLSSPTKLLVMISFGGF